MARQHQQAVYFMDETNETQRGTGPQALFGLTPKPMVFLINHSLGEKIKSPSD